MNILFLVPYAPTPVRARSYNLIRCLARRGHTLTLATLWETEREREALAGLAGEGVEVLWARLPRARALANLAGAAVSGRPLQADYCWQPALAGMVELRLQAEPRLDIIHVEHLRGARYGLRLKTAAGGRPVVWDSVDCISLLFEQAARNSRSRFGRWMTQFELGRTRRYEAVLPGRFDRVLVSSPADKEALGRLGPPGAARIDVLPNGVDLDYFSPGPTVRSDNTVVLTGKMSYHANVTAALHLVEDVMPRVWSERPDVRVEVVGQAPPRAVRALAARHAPRVSVTGYVSDLRPFLRSAAVAVAPIVYGAGSQFKVLEAMACAAPVVATPRAVAAFQAVPGRDVLVAGDAPGLAEHILRLLADAELRRQVGRAGLAYVTRQHHWCAISGNLEGVYRELVGRLG